MRTYIEEIMFNFVPRVIQIFSVGNAISPASGFWMYDETGSHTDAPATEVTYSSQYNELRFDRNFNVVTWSNNFKWYNNFDAKDQFNEAGIFGYRFMGAS